MVGLFCGSGTHEHNTRQAITVVNLSNTNLSDAEISLLSKGLSFCPTPPRLDTTQIGDDLHGELLQAPLTKGVFC